MSFETPATGGLARVANGDERWEAGASIPSHRHGRAYVALVLSGSYEECGNRGRFRVGPGSVLIHGAFDRHFDRFGHRGAHILNLLADHPFSAASIGSVADADAIMRAAESSAEEARSLLRAQLRAGQAAHLDWPDALAHDLIHDATIRLGDWARRHGLAAATVSRGFGKVFGVTPAAFRSEARAHRALGMIGTGREPLAAIAAAAGFADQAHMSRALRALTGSAPGHWRRSNPCKT